MKRWPNKPLGEVCSINPKLVGSNGPGPDAEVTFVPMAAVDEVSGIIARPERRQYSEVAKGYTPFMTNDVLFAKITPCMQNGKAAVASNLCNGFGFGSTEFHVLRSTGSVLPRWVFAFIRQPAFRSAAEASFTGSAGQQRVPADFLKSFPIPVPPLGEQERIVKMLDEADELRKLRAQADRRTANLIPALFNEMFGKVDSNSKKWPMVRFAEIGESRLGKMLDAKQQTGQNKRLYLRNANVQWDRLDLGNMLEMDFSESDRKEFRLRYGDLLICEGGEVGRASIWRDELTECYFQKALHRVRLYSSKAIPEYVLHLLQAIATTSGFRDYVGSATTPHLTGVKLASIRIPLPPLPLQKEFAARVSEIRAMQAEQAASRRRLDDLFQSMLHRAFNGEL